MSTLPYGIAWAVIALLIRVCLKGAFHLIQAGRSRKTQNVKALLLAELRVGLILAGLIIIVVTHGRGIKLAQVLLLIMLSLGLPQNWRTLRGYIGPPQAGTQVPSPKDPDLTQIKKGLRSQ